MPKTAAQLKQEFDDFPQVWEEIRLNRARAAPFLRDCTTTEADILRRWKAALAGGADASALDAIIADARTMRTLRTNMGEEDAPLPVPLLSGQAAVTQAKALLDAGDAAGALAILADGEMLAPEDFKLLIPQPDTDSAHSMSQMADEKPVAEKGRSSQTCLTRSSITVGLIGIFFIGIIIGYMMWIWMRNL